MVLFRTVASDTVSQFELTNERRQSAKINLLGVASKSESAADEEQSRIDAVLYCRSRAYPRPESTHRETTAGGFYAIIFTRDRICAFREPICDRSFVRKMQEADDRNSTQNTSMVQIGSSLRTNIGFVATTFKTT